MLREKFLSALNVVMSYLRLQKRFSIKPDIEIVDSPTWERMILEPKDRLKALGKPQWTWSDKTKANLGFETSG